MRWRCRPRTQRCAFAGTPTRFSRLSLGSTRAGRDGPGAGCAQAHFGHQRGALLACCELFRLRVLRVLAISPPPLRRSTLRHPPPRCRRRWMSCGRECPSSGRARTQPPLTWLLRSSAPPPRPRRARRCRAAPSALRTRMASRRSRLRVSWRGALRRRRCRHEPRFRTPALLRSARRHRRRRRRHRRGCTRSRARRAAAAGR